MKRSNVRIELEIVHDRTEDEIVSLLEGAIDSEEIFEKLHDYMFLKDGKPGEIETFIVIAEGTEDE